MKLKLLFSVLIFSSSVSYANTTIQTKCVDYESEYQTTGYNILESSIQTDSNILMGLESNTPITVTYFHTECSTSKYETHSVVENPQPDMPQIGDTRTFIQERGNQITTYYQEYRAGGWWTTRTETDFLDLPTDPV